MAPLLRFQTVERGFAHVAERHSPQAGTSPSLLVESDVPHRASTPVFLERRDTITGPSGSPVVSIPSLSSSSRALAGVIVFLGIVVLGVAFLKIRRCMRRRTPRRSPSLKSLSLCPSPLPEKIVSEKRNPLSTQTLIDLGYDCMQPLAKARLHPLAAPPFPDADTTVGWVPKIRIRPEDTKDASEPDFVARPHTGLALPAPAVQRTSRFSRLAALVVRSPRPSVTSFLPVSPRPSATSTPRSSLSSASSAAALLPHRLPTPVVEGLRPKKKQPKQKPTRLLPTRAEVPRGNPPSVPEPSEDSAHVITIAEVTRTVLAAGSDSGVPGVQPLMSPSRLDSARPAQAIKAGEEGQRSPRSPAPESTTKQGGGLSARPTSITSTRMDNGHNSSPTKPRAPTTSKGGSEASTSATGSTFPRLVIVVQLYKPSMDDELDVRRGEVLWMTEEFRDGWCAVERLDGVDSGAERGVIPRFCVADRSAYGSQRSSTSSAYSPVTPAPS
ncbi:hypothetical protein M0805_002697 [Coniferiporia weirii]|nr:hypothetical protein M0805_002697 [Coniferiporia weirii]